ncbi:MAG TPA: type III pantothenate kinase [Candidatus Hydrogenedentes bacterium]|nr:type III pantothenate kinase [Candidatus Hydrogenedentota bacterium]
MLLVMDVGNTQTVLGLYDGDILRGHWRIFTNNYRTSDELRVLFFMLLQSAGIDPGIIEGCCISSVVPQINLALEHVCKKVFGAKLLMVGPGVKTGLVLQVENPKEVGADRIVNSVAARAEHEGPLVVIDFGTATTFDAVTAKGEWRGGVIVPGLQLSADVLFERCAKLPRVDIAVPPSVIGRDTIANIRSGLTYGYADLVDGLVRRMGREMQCEPTTVATGGLAELIADLTDTIDVVDPLLTLKGLRLVYERNEKQL